MKSYNSNWVFVDLLFNLLVGFTCLFVLSFMLINPVAKKGTIDPPVLFMIESDWGDESLRDVDLYLRGPDGTVVYYGNKDGSYMVLQRDDLGTANDTYNINGESVTITRNYEVINLSQLPPGEYVVNVHHFSRKGDGEEVNVRGTLLSPYQNVFERAVFVHPRQEITVVSFRVNPEGLVWDIRTDIQIPLRETRR